MVKSPNIYLYLILLITEKVLVAFFITFFMSVGGSDFKKSWSRFKETFCCNTSITNGEEWLWFFVSIMYFCLWCINIKILFGDILCRIINYKRTQNTVFVKIHWIQSPDGAMVLLTEAASECSKDAPGDFFEAWMLFIFVFVCAVFSFWLHNFSCFIPLNFYLHFCVFILHSCIIKYNPVYVQRFSWLQYWLFFRLSEIFI